VAGRRGSYAGVADPEQRFETMRPALERLRALELAQPRPSPAGEALGHAIVSIRLAANAVTRHLEFFGLHYRPEDDPRAQVVTTFDQLRPTLDGLRQMAAAYHPATPESRALCHAADALRLAADTLTGRHDFYRLISSDRTSTPRRGD
jgi:hypothetical protein